MLTDIQQWWSEEHAYVHHIARASKNPMAALFDMYKRYEALNSEEKEEIDNLLIQWIEKADVESVSSGVINNDGSYPNDELHTALECVSDYEIVAAIPAMERLCVRLKDCKIPDNPLGFHEREKVLRKLKGLEKG